MKSRESSVPTSNASPDHDKIGSAVEDEDFVIHYQAGFPDPDGIGYTPHGDWSVFPPSGAAPAVRLKIQFLPRILRGDGASRGIESVLLHYKQGR